MEGFDIREPWQEGKILINKFEFAKAKIDLVSDEGFCLDDAAMVTRFHVEGSVNVADKAIKKMMRV